MTLLIKKTILLSILTCLTVQMSWAQSAPPEKKSFELTRDSTSDATITDSFSVNTFRSEKFNGPYEEEVPYDVEEEYTEEVAYTVDVEYSEYVTDHRSERVCEDVTRHREECCKEQIRQVFENQLTYNVAVHFPKDAVLDVNKKEKLRVILISLTNESVEIEIKNLSKYYKYKIKNKKITGSSIDVELEIDATDDSTNLN